MFSKYPSSARLYKDAPYAAAPQWVYDKHAEERDAGQTRTRDPRARTCIPFPIPKAGLSHLEPPASLRGSSYYWQAGCISIDSEGRPCC